MMVKVFKETLSVDLGEFPTISYANAMEKYGSDKPDLRNPLQLEEVKHLFNESDFKVLVNRQMILNQELQLLKYQMEKL